MLNSYPNFVVDQNFYVNEINFLQVKTKYNKIIKVL